MNGQYGSGFFNYCNGATIRNLTIDGSISSAGVVGTSIVNGRIENCHNRASVTGTSGNVAGIASNATATDFIGCTNSGDITTISGSIGGIVATLVGPALIEDCTNSGAINGGQQVGGIVGLVRIGTVADVTVRGCSNTGEVKTLYPASDSITNYDSAGGIVGSADGMDNALGELAELIIEDCVNSGNVSGTVNRIGGICGSASGRMQPTDLRIINCVNTGNVANLYTGGNPNIIRYIYVGGILGKTDGLSGGEPPTKEIITGNTNNGNVTAGGGGNVSSIVAGKEGTITNNSSSVLVGNDKNDSNIIYTGPSGPSGPNPPDPNPSGPNSPSLPTGTPSSSVVDATTEQETGIGVATGTSIDNRPSQTLPRDPAAEQPLSASETPTADGATATEVSLTPIPLGLGFQTVANTILTLAVGFVTLGIFVLGGFIFWRMYRRRIDTK
jgi:hypothetical protein